MRIVDLLSKDSILLNASPKNKAEAIDLLVDLQVKGGKITDREAYKQGILAREENGSTAVGEGIAIPHAKNAAVKAPSLAAMTVPDGVDYEALDDEPSNLLFMIAAPSDGGDVHLEVLSRLMVILMDEDFRAKLLAAKSKEAFLQVIDEMEREKYPDEPQEAPKAALEAPANRKEEITEAAEIKMKYKGYIERERLIADKMHRLEDIKIKGRFNYSELHEISTEGRQKLERIDPETLAQASRIPGVSPSDINVMLVLLGR